jgi:hypothetical protein
LQRDKLTAEDKARATAEEQARLAAEGARAAEQAKAAAEAKAAEDARLTAEKKKLEEEAKVTEAERAKAAAQAKAKAAEEARAAQEARAAELQKAIEAAKANEAEKRAKAAAEAKAVADGKVAGDKPGTIASLSPADKPGDSKPAADDIPRLLQSELRRVGCLTGSIDASWNDAAQRSLALFNKSAGTTLDTKVASLDTLDVVRARAARVCPLMCDHGYKANGDTCIKAECKTGYELDDSGDCVRVKSTKPEAKQNSKPDESQPAQGKSATIEPQSSNRPLSQSDKDFLHKCGATSCSQAMRGCLRKQAITGGDPNKCVELHQHCMQTGQWIARYCQFQGLSRN